MHKQTCDADNIVHVAHTNPEVTLHMFAGANWSRTLAGPNHARRFFVLANADALVTKLAPLEPRGRLRHASGPGNGTGTVSPRIAAKRPQRSSQRKRERPRARARRANGARLNCKAAAAGRVELGLGLGLALCGMWGLGASPAAGPNVRGSSPEHGLSRIGHGRNFVFPAPVLAGTMVLRDSPPIG